MSIYYDGARKAIERSLLMEEIKPNMQDLIVAKTLEINNLRADYVEQLSNRFQELFLPMLRQWNQIWGFSFRAYTPYFNDGDSCEFSVHELELRIKGINAPSDNPDPDSDEGEIDLEDSRWLRDNEGYSSYWFPKYDKLSPSERQLWGTREDFSTINQQFTELNTIFQSIPPDIVQSALGDHIQVTITRDGIDIQEYEHD